MKYKGFICGVIIGAVGMTTVGVTAADNIANAIINDSVTFDFGNNVKKALALNYNDSLYVPARFVAEGLGAEVDWNEAENTVKITPKEIETQQPTTIPPTTRIITPTTQETTTRKQETTTEEETETTTKKQETTTKKETWKDTTSYETLPIRLNYPEMNITATLLQWDREATKLYINLENRGSEPLNLQPIETVTNSL